MLGIIVFTVFVPLADAAVRVKGYYRKDGTYVQPHYRSNPDGNPYNNWSYPGNTNPYTGETATGNSDTYLKNYYNSNSSSSSSSSLYNYCSPSSSYPGYYFGGSGWFYDNKCTKSYNPLSNYSSSTVNNTNNSSKDLSTMNNLLVKGTNGTKVYKIIDGKKYWIPTAERFKLFGYKWSDVKIIDDYYLNDKDDGTITYKEGTLLKSSNLPFIWFIDKNFTRKWIVAASDFEKCGFKWSNIYTVQESEIQSLDWKGDVSDGKIIYPLCK